MSAKLAAALDEARYVRYDPRDDTVLAWFGGHGIHVYNANGDELDLFNVGDFSKNDASLEDVKKAVVRHLREG